jgi:hypothetical protein
MAASATFALKAGVWFRRGRLLIISPVQQPSWLLSGRNPTYPVVQILQATSARSDSDAPRVDIKSLHAKIGELTLENDFLEGALGKAGLLSAKR